MQVQETYCAVVIFLTYWVLESGEGFFSLAFFFFNGVYLVQILWEYCDNVSLDS